jgi:hypothetical protein
MILFDADLLSLLETVESGGHDARAGIKPTGDAGTCRVPGEIDLMQRHGARRLIDDPDEIRAILGEHR